MEAFPCCAVHAVMLCRACGDAVPSVTVGLPVLGEPPWCPLPGRALGVAGWKTPWLYLTHNTVYRS